MALVTVMSAKGAPGASTTAMLVAALWPQDTLLVDADPSGGDIALRLPRLDGRALDRDRGLLSLLPLARRGVTPELVREHSQTALGGQRVLAGLAGPEQSRAVGPLWVTLAEAFARLPGADVVVDAGQVHSQAPHLALVHHADALLVVYRPTAWSVLHTRRRLEALADHLSESPTRVGLVGIADAKDKADCTAAVATIRGDWRWVQDLGVVAHDPKAVVMFEGGEVYRPERSLLARSGRALADATYAELAPLRPVPAAEPAAGPAAGPAAASEPTEPAEREEQSA